jgi:peptidoglycan/LPS O-acetylase OafA/YrhL
VSKIIPELDGVRALAILAVIVYHVGSSGRTAYERIFSATMGVGWCGVDLFFVLSGFLITGILIDIKGAPHALRNFYVRRILRIFPLYYLTLLVFLHVVPAVGHLFSRFQSFVPTDEAWFWLYASNWSPSLGMAHAELQHLWSLSIEEQFYMVWPLLVFGLSRRAMLLVACGIVILSPLLRVAWYSPDTGVLLYRNTVFRTDSLAFGALCAFAIRDSELLSFAMRIRPALLAISVPGILVCVVASWSQPQFSPPMIVIGGTFLGCLFGYLVLWATKSGGGSLHSMLRLRLLRSIGKYSYAMYVFHIPIFALLRRLFFPASRLAMVTAPLPFTILLAVEVSTTIAVTYAAALVSWNVFERHFLRLKSRFEYAG